MIEIKDIEKLAELSRIRVSDADKKIFLKDIESILGYVDLIKKVAGNDQAAVREPELRNVFREDINSHDSGQFTESLLECAPKKEDGYIKVKKIL